MKKKEEEEVKGALVSPPKNSKSVIVKDLVKRFAEIGLIDKKAELVFNSIINHSNDRGCVVWSSECIETTIYRIYCGGRLGWKNK